MLCFQGWALNIEAVKLYMNHIASSIYIGRAFSSTNFWYWCTSTSNCIPPSLPFPAYYIAGQPTEVTNIWPNYAQIQQQLVFQPIDDGSHAKFGMEHSDPGPKIQSFDAFLGRNPHHMPHIGDQTFSRTSRLESDVEWGLRAGHYPITELYTLPPKIR